MQTYPLKIKRHTAKSAGDKFKAARINDGLKLIETSINRIMARMPEGLVYMIDGVEAENEFGTYYSDFCEAITRLGERGRSIVVFKGDRRRYSAQRILEQQAKFVRRRVFGKSPDDYDC